MGSGKCSVCSSGNDPATVAAAISSAVFIVSGFSSRLTQRKPLRPLWASRLASSSVKPFCLSHYLGGPHGQRFSFDVHPTESAQAALRYELDVVVGQVVATEIECDDVFHPRSTQQLREMFFGFAKHHHVLQRAARDELISHPKQRGRTRESARGKSADEVIHAQAELIDAIGPR